jgi:hypothetical protein
MTITISNVESTVLETIVSFLRSKQVPFEIKKTKAEVLEDIRLAMLEVRHKERTGERGQTLRELLDEVDEELKLENQLQHAN